jgi:hypothetical protein
MLCEFKLRKVPYVIWSHSILCEPTLCAANPFGHTSLRRRVDTNGRRDRRAWPEKAEMSGCFASSASPFHGRNHFYHVGNRSEVWRDDRDPSDACPGPQTIPDVVL